MELATLKQKAHLKESWIGSLMVLLHVLAAGNNELVWKPRVGLGKKPIGGTTEAHVTKANNYVTKTDLEIFSIGINVSFISYNNDWIQFL